MGSGVEPLSKPALKLNRAGVVRGFANHPRVKAKLTVKIGWLATANRG
jgi:hypothetical protein